MDKDEAHQPLHPTSLSDNMSDHEYEPLSVRHSNKKSRICLLIALVLLLVSTNIIWLWAYSYLQPAIKSVQRPYCEMMSFVLA